MALLYHEQTILPFRTSIHLLRHLPPPLLVFSPLLSNQLIHLIAVPMMTASVIAILGMIPFAMQFGKYTIGVADLAVAALLIYFFAIHMTFAVMFSPFRQER